MRRFSGSPEGGDARLVGREVDTTSRPTPLTLVSDAVAGGDLRDVAATVARTLGCPIAIAIPALGGPALVPECSADDTAIAAYAERAVAAGGPPAHTPRAVSDAVPVRIAGRVVGIVAAISGNADPHPTGPGPTAAPPDRQVWLEAAAAAASVTTLIRESDERPVHPVAGSEIITELCAAEPEDLAPVVARARQAGVELRAGGIALAARRARAGENRDAADASRAALAVRLAVGSPMLVASPMADRLHVLLPISPITDVREDANAVAALLRTDGWAVVLSAPRRKPAQLRQALLEVELLADLQAHGELAPGQEDTYRLLIGVLLRDPDELEQLREQTITSLAQYDARHDTQLLATLRAFLLHDGSTTETAEAMRLHRHTVGYRLSRVHEVSGLSPYESAGRERLGLGLKAAQIIAADRRAHGHARS